MDEQKKNHLDLNKTKSKRTGMSGLFENAMRKVHSLGYFVLMAPISIMYVICLGCALTPGILAFQYASELSTSWHPILHALSLGLSIGVGFFGYIITIILVVPLMNFLCPLKMKPYKGGWISIPTMGWYIHNSLAYLVRYTILDFILPSPLGNFYFRLMGMKIGRNVTINSSNISDPGMITLEDGVTIGGSASLMAHYAVKGYLVIDPLVIKKKTTVGLKATIFGGVVVGERVTITPHSVVLPKTNIPDDSKFGVS